MIRKFLQRNTKRKAAAVIFALSLCWTNGLAGSISRVDVLTSYDIPESRWLDHEQARATGTLAGMQADVLVVPFQILGHGFDSTSRSLMTLSLAYRIETGTSLSVADPVLVSRALGSNKREFDDASIARLARLVGASTVIVGRIGHDRDGHYEILVKSATVNEGLALEVGDEAVFEKKGIPFDSRELPYYSFLKIRDEILSNFLSELSLAQTIRPLPPDIAYPPSFDDLTRSSDDSLVVAAHYLQFLGLLHPEATEERARDLLFERSLVLLEYLDPKAESYSSLKSRALLALNRRTAAVAELGGSRGLPAQALLAFANGNATDAVAIASRISSPLIAQMAELQGERLRLAYGRDENSDLLNRLTNIGDIWGPLLRCALTDMNSWRSNSSIQLKASLDAAFPDKKLSLDAFITRQAISRGISQEYEIAKLILTHLDKVEESAIIPHPLGPRVTDYTDLVRNMLVGNVYQKILRTTGRVSKPQQAVEFSNLIEPLFDGNPALAIAKSTAVWDLSARSSGIEQQNLQEEALELARLGLWWTGRLTRGTFNASQQAEWYFPRYMTLGENERAQSTYSSDWPRPAALYFYGAREIRMAAHKNCLENTISSFQCFMEYHSMLRLSGQDADAKAVLEKNRHRFVGHPQRLDYLARQFVEAGDQAAADAMYREAIDSDTPDWKPYERIATTLLRQSKYQQALEVVEKYPGFRGLNAASRVEISNNAYGFGSQLYWAGAVEQAKAMYEVAASLNTGSEAELTSEVRLALIGEKFEAAIQFTLMRAQRYNSKYAVRDLIGLLSLIGRTDSAWDIVNGIQNRFNEPELWTGALIAHRATDTSPDEIVKWAFADDRINADDVTGSLSLRYVFLANTTDRMPTDSLAKTLRDLDPRDRPSRTTSGKLLDNGLLVYPPRFFPIRTKSEAVTGVAQAAEEVDRRLVMAAQAMTAIYRGDFEHAFRVLDEASNYFELHEFLPLYAWASAKIGQTTRIEKYLESSTSEKGIARARASLSTGILFDEYLARSFILAVQGKHAEAVEMLKKTNSDVLHTQRRHIFTRYQIMESARLLFEDTGDHRYRLFALDLARQNAVIEPIQSYSHSFVAMLSDDKRERISSLARVLVLDPQSRCVEKADESELQQARLLARNGYSARPFEHTET